MHLWYHVQHTSIRFSDYYTNTNVFLGKNHNTDADAYARYEPAASSVFLRIGKHRWLPLTGLTELKWKKKIINYDLNN